MAASASPQRQRPRANPIRAELASELGPDAVLPGDGPAPLSR
jgi:hypothetical protein